MAFIIAQIITVLIGAFGAVVLLGKLEREVVRPLADDVNKVLEPILNPGLVVLALVGVVVFLRARR